MDRAQPGLVDTGVAVRVASKFAIDPMAGSYLMEDLADSFALLVAEAEPLVANEAGFGPATPVQARILSRAEWASANIESAVNLLSPLLERVQARMPVVPGVPSPAGFMRRAYGSALGAQLGGVLGFVSQRVLGQYELAPVNAGDVWFVGPNIVITERRLAFVPRDFRLWVAVHELTHRAQFEGNPWMRDYFSGLVTSLLGSLELEPFSMLDRAVRALRVPGGGDATPMGIRLLDDNQRRIFDRLSALMTVLEGHGNFIMDRVGAEVIPTQPRMRRTLSGGSLDGPLGKILRRVLGLDMKKLQYEEGQRFFDAVHAATGREGVASVFAAPERLPTMEELRAPQTWLSRSGL